MRTLPLCALALVMPGMDPGARAQPATVAMAGQDPLIAPEALFPAPADAYSALAINQTPDLAPDLASDAGADPATQPGAPTPRRSPRPLAIAPYIEAQQVVEGTFGTGGDVLTYSVLAAGGDAAIHGRATQGVISARYERRIAGSRADGGEGVSGIVRMATSLTEGLRLDYGAYANRAASGGNGSVFASGAARGDGQTRIYAAYGGPTLATRLGDVAIGGHYHAGLTSVDSSVPAGTVLDVLDHAVTQNARLSASTRAGDMLPVGLGVDAGFYQEDVANLSQRVSDRHARASVTIPVAADLALVGGAGYEHVRVSSRDALRDGTGAAIRDAQGRLVTDMAAPRTIAFDTQGLIWDVGVEWHPDARTRAEGHVGQRYGQIGGYGLVQIHPGDHSHLDLMVYEGITGVGGALTEALFGLPTEFSPVRDAISGNLSGCVATLSGGGCVGGALASVAAAVYRGRGVSLAYGLERGRLRAGLGMGYDRRQYIAAPGTILAPINGLVDQYYWLSAFMGYRLTPHSGVDASINVYKHQSGWNSTGGESAVRAVAMYHYVLSHHLIANASIAMDGITRQAVEDLWGATGALGMRYNF